MNAELSTGRSAEASRPSRLSVQIERPFPGGPIIRARLELDLQAAPITVFFGPSGSGKTTLLRCIAGLDRPRPGTIILDQDCWCESSSGRWQSPQQRRVGVLFQDYALFPHLTVQDNIGFGLRRMASEQRRLRVRDLAELLELTDLLHRLPHQLSGGQQQRTALARSLAIQPRLLLLDEPLSALDAPTRARVRGELRRLLLSTQTPSLVVTHDRLEALTLGDRLVVMSGGEVLQEGPVEEVFSRPTSLEVAQIVGTETVAPAILEPGDGGLSLAQVGRSRLLVSAGDASAAHPGRLAGSDAFVCIRAEDVLLERPPGSRTSARNHLEGIVVELQPEGALVRVVLDCGFRLVALVTRPACAELGLEAGRAVIATVKTSAITVVRRR